MKKHIPPIEFAFSKLNRNYILGVGEAHWYPDIVKCQIDLICNERLDDVFYHLILESGTQKDQKKINDFINSYVNLSDSELLQITVQSLSAAGSIGPHIPLFFKHLRLCNERRKEKKLAPLIIHFPEPFCDRKNKNEGQIQSYNKQRDKAYFKYLNENNLLNTKGVIVYMGAYHLVRASHSLGGLLNYSYPEKMITILPHLTDRVKEIPSAIESVFRYAQLHQYENTIFDVHNSPFSMIKANDLFASPALDTSEQLSRYVDAYWHLGKQLRVIDKDFLERHRLIEAIGTTKLMANLK